jgi:DNA (cytosine-5)-methyltransferase 1
VVSNTGSELFDYKENRHLSKEQLCQVGTFPIDYNFLNNPFKYMIGMSVPPVMVAQIASQLYSQILK